MRIKNEHKNNNKAFFWQIKSLRERESISTISRRTSKSVRALSMRKPKEMKMLLSEIWSQTKLLCKTPHLRNTLLTCAIQFGLTTRSVFEYLLCDEMSMLDFWLFLANSHFQLLYIDDMVPWTVLSIRNIWSRTPRCRSVRVYRFVCGLKFNYVMFLILFDLHLHSILYIFIRKISIFQ